MRSTPSTVQEIPLRKGKLALFLVLALGFVVVSVGLSPVGWFHVRRLAWFVEGVGVVGAVFFGACAVFCVIRLLSRRPGLVIDRGGIVDDTSYSSVGRVPWSQIVDVTITRMPTYWPSLFLRATSPRIMVIDVRQPQLFVGRGNWLQRLLRRGSIDLLGSPVVISGSILHADLDDLARRIRQGASAS